MRLGFGATRSRFLAQTAQVHTGVDHSIVLGEDQVLDGGDALPGLALPLRELFLRRD